MSVYLNVIKKYNLMSLIIRETDVTDEVGKYMDTNTTKN